MSLDQDLMEVEPILRGTDGTFQFSHPSFQEILAAKQFADEINSGRLNVRDAYVNFWSYVEDKELWGLEDLTDDGCRALLPDWKNVLLLLVAQLKHNKARELVDIVAKNYVKANIKLSNQDYNPFIEDYKFGFMLAKINDLLKSSLYKNILRWIFDYNKVRNRSELSNSRSDLSHYNFSILRLSREEHLLIFDSAISVFDGIDNEIIVDFLIRHIQNKGRNGLLAVKLLGAIGDDRAVETLIEYMKEGRHRNTYKEVVNCKEASFALLRIRSHKGVDALINYLRDKNNHDGFLPTIALGNIGTKKAIDALIEFYMQHKHNPMELHGVDLALALSRSKKAIDLLIQDLRDKSNPNRHHLAFALRVNNIEELVQNVDVLIEYIQDRSNPIRDSIVFELGQTKSQKAVDVLIKYIQDRSNPRREYAVLGLGAIGGKKAVGALVDYIKDKNNPKRGQAAEALSEIGGEEAIRAFIWYINEINPNKIDMSPLNGPNIDNIATDILVEYMRDRNNPYLIRSAVAKVLGRIANEKAIDAVVEYMQDGSKPYKDLWYLEVLEKTGTKRVIKTLRESLKDDYVSQDAYNLIYKIHQRLRPKGYNLPVKRLTARDIS